VSEQRLPSEVMAEASDLLERAIAGSGVELPAGELQRLLAAAVRLFVARIERGSGAPPFPPAGAGQAPTATDVMVAATEFLAATEIELFELGMWQTWGGVHAGGTAGPTGSSNGA
jgi:hypothetical protein